VSATPTPLMDDILPPLDAMRLCLALRVASTSCEQQMTPSNCALGISFVRVIMMHPTHLSQSLSFRLLLCSLPLELVGLCECRAGGRCRWTTWTLQNQRRFRHRLFTVLCTFSCGGGVVSHDGFMMGIASRQSKRIKQPTCLRCWQM